jgi:hypothetical protein
MTGKTIAFHSSQLSMRGTEVAMYDYAVHNEHILANRSLIVTPRNARDHDASTISKFESRFNVVFYDSWTEVDKLLSRAGADRLYMIKTDRCDRTVAESVPTVVHAVFPWDPATYHGSVFAYVSEWLSKECSNGRIPFVPHIVHLPKAEGDLRAELGIPADALVLGCYGGEGSFNLPFAKSAVGEMAAERRDLHFLFMNIRPFAEHERIRFLPANAGMTHKTRFVATCDGMLHGRSKGETFGLACGEFSILNKPVLTYAHSPQRCHLEILGEAALRYGSKSELVRLLRGLDRQSLANGNWDRYSARFSPELVMQAFKAVFIDVIDAPAFRPGRPKIGPADWAKIVFNRQVHNALLWRNKLLVGR